MPVRAGRAWPATAGRRSGCCGRVPGTKDPAYSDVKYVTELIGPDTVNTVPPQTLAAFRDHGTALVTLTEGVDEAHHILETLDNIGISLTEVTDRLLDDGLRLFVGAFDRLLTVVEQKRGEGADE